MVIYHCNKLNLCPGDIIAPGMWVGNLTELGPTHSLWNREIMVESIRLKYNNDKPSRLFSTYGYTSLESIMLYRNIHMPDGHIYKVEHMDESLPLHQGEYHDIISGGLTTVHLSSAAIRYWEMGHRINVLDWEQIKGCEVISTSPLRVLEAVN